MVREAAGFCCFREIGCAPGCSGFLLFYVEKDSQKKVREALEDLLYVPFAFENAGTKVVHYTPESYTPRL